MLKTLEYVEDLFGNQPIKISAQTYLIPFYESLGFQKTGAEYLEDGIPHIAMVHPAP
jgi:ElaA protein